MAAVVGKGIIRPTDVDKSSGAKVAMVTMELLTDRVDKNMSESELGGGGGEREVGVAETVL